MKAKVAVATVSGKAYFFIVNKLKEKNIPFISLIPGEPVPAEVSVVLTTAKEKRCINHGKILVYDADTEPDIIADEVRKLLQGKEVYEKIVIGVDPGEVFGLAVIADGAVNETGNCYSAYEVMTKIKSIIRTVDLSSTAVTIKVGSGVPAYKELMELLDACLPLEAVLEVVSEAGTTRAFREDTHRRSIKDIASAIRIAGRAGHIYPRRRSLESDS
ncbi:MAG: hypothetical protein N3E52_01710 [Candidatus Bathyarchaeota archaeon]|nr:hypothetical protein [Candidatus Bathyarchaeota archaeon]